MARLNLCISIILLVYNCQIFAKFLPSPLLIEFSKIEEYVNEITKILEKPVTNECGLEVQLKNQTHRIDEIDEIWYIWQYPRSKIYDHLIHGYDWIILNRYMRKVDNLYERYINIDRKQCDGMKSYIINFIDTVMSMGNDNDEMGNSYQQQMYWFFGKVIKNQSRPNESLLFEWNQMIQDSQSNICNYEYSVAQWVSELYNTIVIKELKKFVLFAYANALIPNYPQVDLKQENLTNVKYNFLEMIRIYMKTWKYTISNNIARDIRSCYPKYAERNYTYLEFAHLFQSIIVLEKNLKNDTCQGSCMDIGKGKQTSDTRIDGLKSMKTSCLGEITDCFGDYSSMEICWAPNESDRRFEWFKDSNNQIYGDNTSTCSETIAKPVSYQYWFRACDLCVCTCIPDLGTGDGSLRTISLMPQTSNILQNRVVTGVMFVEKYEMIHIQIKEGKLSSGGFAADSENWVPLGNVTEQHHYSNRLWIPPKDVEDSPMIVTMKRGEHYGFVGKHRRTLNLDDILIPKGHVVTGVKFGLHDSTASKDNVGNVAPSFELLVRATPVDFVSGKLNTSKDATIWISAATMDPRPSIYNEPRSELKLVNPDHPFKHKFIMPDSEPNQYVKFQATDMKLDAAQSTVPFFDAMPVQMKPGFPLSGIGVFHKGYKGSSGFVALKIFSYDISEEIKFENN